MGTVVSMVRIYGYYNIYMLKATTPLIIDRMGWEAVFFLTGGLGAIWYMLWQLLAADSPSGRDKEIVLNLYLLVSYWTTEQEKYIIERGIPQKKYKNDFFSIPWKKIFSSIPVSDGFPI